jgi:hypothetical protein
MNIINKTKIKLRLNIDLYSQKSKKDLDDKDMETILFTIKDFLRHKVEEIALQNLKITTIRNEK